MAKLQLWQSLSESERKRLNLVSDYYNLLVDDGVYDSKKIKENVNIEPNFKLVEGMSTEDLIILLKKKTNLEDKTIWELVNYMGGITQNIKNIDDQTRREALEKSNSSFYYKLNDNDESGPTGYREEVIAKLDTLTAFYDLIAKDMLEMADADKSELQSFFNIMKEHESDVYDTEEFENTVLNWEKLKGVETVWTRSNDLNYMASNCIYPGPAIVNSYALRFALTTPHFVGWFDKQQLEILSDSKELYTFVQLSDDNLITPTMSEVFSMLGLNPSNSIHKLWTLKLIYLYFVLGSTMSKKDKKEYVDSYIAQEENVTLLQMDEKLNDTEYYPVVNCDWQHFKVDSYTGSNIDLNNPISAIEYVKELGHKRNVDKSPIHRAFVEQFLNVNNNEAYQTENDVKGFIVNLLQNIYAVSSSKKALHDWAKDHNIDGLKDELFQLIQKYRENEVQSVVGINSLMDLSVDIQSLLDKHNIEGYKIIKTEDMSTGIKEELNKRADTSTFPYEPTRTAVKMSSTDKTNLLDPSNKPKEIKRKNEENIESLAQRYANFATDNFADGYFGLISDIFTKFYAGEDMEEFEYLLLDIHRTYFMVSIKYERNQHKKRPIFNECSDFLTLPKWRLVAAQIKLSTLDYTRDGAPKKNKVNSRKYVKYSGFGNDEVKSGSSLIQLFSGDISERKIKLKTQYESLSAYAQKKLAKVYTEAMKIETVPYEGYKYSKESLTTDADYNVFDSKYAFWHGVQQSLLTMVLADDPKKQFYKEIQIWETNFNSYLLIRGVGCILTESSLRSGSARTTDSAEAPVRGLGYSSMEAKGYNTWDYVIEYSRAQEEFIEKIMKEFSDIIPIDIMKIYAPVFRAAMIQNLGDDFRALMAMKTQFQEYANSKLYNISEEKDDMLVQQDSSFLQHGSQRGDIIFNLLAFYIRMYYIDMTKESGVYEFYDELEPQQKILSFKQFNKPLVWDNVWSDMRIITNRFKKIFALNDDEVSNVEFSIERLVEIQSIWPQDNVQWITPILLRRRFRASRANMKLKDPEYKNDANRIGTEIVSQGARLANSFLTNKPLQYDEFTKPLLRSEVLQLMNIKDQDYDFSLIDPDKFIAVLIEHIKDEGNVRAESWSLATVFSNIATNYGIEVEYAENFLGSIPSVIPTLQNGDYLKAMVLNLLLVLG